MRIHVVLKKEDVDITKINDKQIIVVLDILLATSTIVTCLSNGAKAVYPVMDRHEALSLKATITDETVLLAGEERGQAISGFLVPAPTLLGEKVNGKNIILSTTNGTVAIRKVMSAKHVFIGSLLNGGAVANYIRTHFESGYSVVVVCSGSDNQFCLEDFYAAGYVIHKMIESRNASEPTLTDSALSAKLFYEKFKDESQKILSTASVGNKLLEQGMKDDISFVSEQDKISIIPTLKGDRITL